MSKLNKTEEEEFGYVIYGMCKYVGIIGLFMWAFIILTNYVIVGGVESVNWVEVMYVGMFGFTERSIPLLILGNIVVIIGFIVYGHLGMVKMEKEWREND